MTSNINNLRLNKIYILAFAISYIYLLLHFNGSIDAFAPLQIGAIEETVNNGFLREEHRNTVPAFYILGSELSIVLGKGSSFLLYSPVQLIPYTFLFFVLIFKISNSYFLASLLAIIELTMGFTGTERIFFWPHGIGSILYFSLLILFLSMFIVKGKSVWQYHIMAVTIGISLVFTSYDVIFTYLLFLALFIAYLSIFNKSLFSNKRDRYNKQSQFIKLLVLLTIVELGLTNFVYNNFVNALKSPESFTLSVFDKFLLSYFSRDVENNIIKDIYLHYPQYISYYGYIKYGVLFIFLIIFLSKFFSGRQVRYNIGSIFIISILSSMIIWAIIRVFIGNIEIGFFYYPAVFSIAWLYKNDRPLRKWATIATILLLVLNPIYHEIIYSEDLSNKDIDKFSYLDLPLLWCKKETNGSMRSDELTKNFYLMLSKTHDFQTLNVADVAFLIDRQYYDQNKYFIINSKLNALSIGNWIQIEPWRVSEYLLGNNKNISKILNSGMISIYINN